MLVMRSRRRFGCQSVFNICCVLDKLCAKQLEIEPPARREGNLTPLHHGKEEKDRFVNILPMDCNDGR